MVIKTNVTSFLYYVIKNNPDFRDNECSKYFINDLIHTHECAKKGWKQVISDVPQKNKLEKTWYRITTEQSNPLSCNTVIIFLFFFYNFVYNYKRCSDTNLMFTQKLARQAQLTDISYLHCAKPSLISIALHFDYSKFRLKYQF